MSYQLKNPLNTHNPNIFSTFYQVKNISKVYDGDTFVCDLIVSGLDVVFINQRVRLYGVDTPEIRGGTEKTKEKAKDVRDWVQKYLEGRGVCCQILKTDSFGRLVCRVFVKIGSEWKYLNQELLTLKYAVPMKQTFEIF